MSRIFARTDRLQEIQDRIHQSYGSMESAAENGKRNLAETLSILQQRLKDAETQLNNARMILHDAEENDRKNRENTVAKSPDDGMPGYNTAQNTAERLLEDARESCREKEKRLRNIQETIKTYRDFQDRYERARDEIVGRYQRLVRDSDTFFYAYIDLLEKSWRAIGDGLPGTGFAAESGDGHTEADQEEEIGSKPEIAGKSKEIRRAEDLDDETFRLSEKHTANLSGFNELMRNNKTSEELERFREIISNNALKTDSTFCRKATLADLAGRWAGLPLEELIGKSYQFQGILSASTGYGMGRGDVEFEVKAPAGTPALDLINTGIFNEVMFDSPLCYIEDAYRIPGGAHLVIRVYSSKEYHQAVDRLKKKEVEHRPIQYSDHQRTDSEIISGLSGGDRTGGSCSSLAMAYAGNQAGYDVLDFRGGDSRQFFSQCKSIANIASLPGVWSRISEMRDDIKNVHSLLTQMEPNRKYYLASGSHAAVVRRNGEGYEYLELQSGTNRRNDWHPLNDDMLRNRFRCSSHRLKKRMSVLIDMESLGKSKEFQDILGYINTSAPEQKKGGSGHER